MLKILVLLKLVPDLAEELEIAPDGRTLDPGALRMIVSERDEHALEAALLLKERHGGTVTAVALDVPDVDDVLFTSLAKGADRAVKISGVETTSTPAAAAALARTLPEDSPADLILTGVQAIDDLDGQVGPVLAHLLERPYLGLVTRMEVDEAAGSAAVTREFAGGVAGRYTVPLPAVLGVQSAEKPPRYVPVAKVRAAMKSQKIEVLPAARAPEPALVEVLSLVKPEVAGAATMLDGSPEEVAAQLCDLLAARGLLVG